MCSQVEHHIWHTSKGFFYFTADVIDDIDEANTPTVSAI